MLALICLHLNVRARTGVLALLPDTLDPAVRDCLRKGSDLTSGDLTQAESRALSLFVKAAPDAEAETDPSQEPNGGGDVDSGEGALESSEVESFFSEADERLERAGKLPLVSDETDGEGTMLPPVLLSLLLLEANPSDAARLLVELPPRFQGQSLDLIATSSARAASRDLDSEEREVIEALRSHLSGRERWGVEPAVHILRASDTTRRLRRAIEATAVIDAEAVSILQDQLFVFEDVLRLEDREFQVLLGRIDNQTLARAMRNASDPVRDRFFDNMSDRRAMLVAEEGEILAELTDEESAEAQKKVLETLRQLYEKGDIMTYFGSVQGQLDADDTDDEEGDDDEDSEADHSAIQAQSEPPPVHVPTERKTVSAVTEPTPFRRFGLLVAGGCLAAVVVTVAVLHFAMRDTPRTLQEETERPKRTEKTTASRSSRAIAIQREQRPMSGEQAEKKSGDPIPSEGTLAAGESMTVANDIQAILLLPAVESETGNVAQVVAEPGSELSREPTADSSASDNGELVLRLGRVRTAILKEGFVVKSPVVEVAGVRGAIFAVRVVLDATTTVEVEQGAVHVRLLKSPGEPFRLVAGQSGHFDSGGGAVIEAPAEPEGGG